MGRRREERQKVTLPVRVWGMDRNGKPFIQSAHATDVTRMGGRLRDLYCIDKKGEVIRIQHGNQKANFKVKWIGMPGTLEDGQVGIYSMEPDKYIWGVPLPKTSTPDAFETNDNLQMMSFDEHPNESGKFSLRNFESAAYGTGAAPGLALKQGEDRAGKRRADPRYACDGTVEVAPEGSSMPVWCILSDISISGCYAETTSPLPAHTKIHAVVKTSGLEFHARGVVRTSHAGVGMGISFTNLGPVDRDRVHALIANLRARSENGTQKASTMVPSSFAAATSAAPPARSPSNDRSLLVAHNRPATPAKPKPSIQLDPNIMARVSQLRTDLWEMQQSLKPNAVDGRLLRELKEAVDHTRHAFWFVQQWVELQSQGRDPFQVIEKLNAERVRLARELNRHLAVDIDGTEIDCDLQGLDDLYLSVRDLHTRLGKLLNKITT